MERFPQELATAIARAFLRGDPGTAVWDQAKGRALEKGSGESQNSDNMAMSTMFVVMKTYDGLERSLRCMSSALSQAHDDHRQLQHAHASEMERLQAELAQIALERDQAIHRDEVAMQEI